MATAGVMRETVDGGMSMCYASEENVGKRRCNHIMTNISFNVEIEKKEKDVKVITVSSQGFDDLSEEVKLGFINDLVSHLTPMSKSELKKTLNVLRTL